jgi:hypothetical protein
MFKRRWLTLVAAALLIATVPGVAGAASPDPEGLWATSVTPPCIADGSNPCNIGDFGSLELGVKFQTSQPIYVVGVRFYRADSGTWSGSLWDADSTWITSADDATSGTGWQTAMFATPVAMDNGDTFVASYFTPTGAYAFEWDYFTSGGLTVGPLTALGGAGVNGLYNYGPSSVFPTQTFRDTNYWVTPLWIPQYTLSGFYAPVDMGGTLNTVKGGSTVPLKFEVFWGDTEQTNVAVVDRFEVDPIVCPGATVPADDIEFTTTGQTSLRYDPTDGQFIQNWKTPKKAGACYEVTMFTVDGSSISAEFKLK